MRLSWTYTVREYAPRREMLRFALCYPEFSATSVDGLTEISLEQLEKGRTGWARNGKKGALIIQVNDEPHGGELRIEAAKAKKNLIVGDK